MITNDDHICILSVNLKCKNIVSKWRFPCDIRRLDRNALSGTVPSSINSLTGLFEMYKSENNFFGVFTLYVHLHFLIDLYRFLSNNQLTGPVSNLSGLNATGINYLPHAQAKRILKLITDVDMYKFY